MMELTQNLAENGAAYIQIALAFIGAFALVATMTPNKTDDKIVNIALKVINFLGANFGKAKNDPKA